MAKASARQFLVKVDGVDGYFATKQGGNVSSDVTKAYDGGALIPDVITSPPTADNVTVTRHFDPDRDNDVITQLRQLVGSWTTTVSVTPTDADLVATAPPLTYPKAVLVSVSEPETDSGSGDAAMWGLEFAISNYR